MLFARRREHRALARIAELHRPGEFQQTTAVPLTDTISMPLFWPRTS